MYRDRNRNRALSLAELIVGLCLFAIAIIPIFGIIPTAYMSIKKAEDYSTASCYAQEVLEIYRMSDPLLNDDYVFCERDLSLNNTDYQLLIGLYGIDPQYPHKLVDIVVTMNWKKIPEQVSIFSRINYDK